jgi:hypothetical protein
MLRHSPESQMDCLPCFNSSKSSDMKLAALSHTDHHNLIVLNPEPIRRTTTNEHSSNVGDFHNSHGQNLAYCYSDNSHGCC